MNALDSTLRKMAGLCVALGLALALFRATPAASQTGALPPIYLPLIASQGPPRPIVPSSVFGMVMSSMTPARGLDDAVAAGAAWMRSDNTILWRQIEPVEGGGYNWNTPLMQRIEREMISASERNVAIIMIVRGSPRWATVPYKADCAPINPSKYQRFASFLAAAVERYSKPPYNVSYWQIGNEPDAYIFSQDSGYGCWGVKSDPYYGGRAYGDMLKVVYPAMKAVNPNIFVLHGSLLLDRPYNPANGSGLSARFLEGVFLAGAASSFDILPFNAYWWTLDNMPDATDWKAKYLIDLQAAYGLPRKPMIATETGLLCSSLSTGCQKAQAYAVGRYYTRALSYNLIGDLWYLYDQDSFYNTALVEPTNVLIKRPAYLAYQHASAMLAGARYLGLLEGQPAGVEGYRLTQRDGASLVVFWSADALPVTIPVAPGAAVACTAWDGAALPCDNVAGTVALTAQAGPTYVVAR
ncbi:MAG: hypothetical protein IPO81_08145 [Kouleothrix sp.]|nr:hypothetical protein [Kouleothrix sp.]